jgi:uncharacterized protein YciI
VFVLDVTYTAPLESVDAVLPAHAAWLDEQFASGAFLVAGRKVPRDGGIILAVGEDREEIERLTATDPFVVAGLGTYRITEFLAVKTAPALEEYRQQPPS